MGSASLRAQRIVAGLVVTLAACLQAVGLLSLPLVAQLVRETDAACRRELCAAVQTLFQVITAVSSQSAFEHCSSSWF